MWSRNPSRESQRKKGFLTSSLSRLGYNCTEMARSRTHARPKKQNRFADPQHRCFSAAGPPRRSHGVCGKLRLGVGLRYLMYGSLRSQGKNGVPRTTDFAIFLERKRGKPQHPRISFSSAGSGVKVDKKMEKRAQSIFGLVSWPVRLLLPLVLIYAQYDRFNRISVVGALVERGGRIQCQAFFTCLQDVSLVESTGLTLLY